MSVLSLTMSKAFYYNSAIERPPLLNDWLECSTSLTDKLQSYIGEITLTVENQEWITPKWFERYFFNIQNESILLREIIMRGCEKTYWYARSLIPLSCYQLDRVFFNRLESESIRNLIFGEQRVSRYSIKCYPINRFNIEYHWVEQYIPIIETTLWVRLSDYVLDNKEHFYLFEILFPELEVLR